MSEGADKLVLICVAELNVMPEGADKLVLICVAELNAMPVHIQVHAASIS